MIMKATEGNQKRDEIISKLKAQQKASKEDQKLWSRSEETLSEELLRKVQMKFNKRKEVKSVASFASLFINETNAAKVIELLIDHEDMSEKREWIANGDLKKPGSAFWVLEDRHLLRTGKDLTRMRTFCLGVGAKKTDNELRNLLKRPDINPHLKEDYTEFASLFEQLK